MAWEVVDVKLPRGRGSEEGAYIRVSRTGAASLSRAAVEVLGNPDYVTILIDRSRDLFAIRAAKAEEAGARMLRRAAVGYTKTMRFANLLRIAGVRKRVGNVSLEYSEEDGLLVGKLEDIRNLPPANEPSPRKRGEGGEEIS